MGVTVIPAGSVEFKHRGGPPGAARVGRAVSTDLSSSMGAGFGEFDGCAIDWTLLYDEVVYVISGAFHVTVDGHTHVAREGDAVWIPEGTRLTYGGEKARIFYAVQPGDWSARQG